MEKLIEKLKIRWQEKKLKNKKRRLMKKIKSGELKMTPKGVAFYEYIEQIAAGTLKPEDRIEVYEEDFIATLEFLKKNLRSKNLLAGLTEESVRKFAASVYCDVWREAYEYSKNYLNLGEN